MMLIQRIPKWLREEPFDIAYEPRARKGRKICIRILDDRRDTVIGYGHNICEAAKAAFKAREEDN